jgi:hypothetical protein
MSRWIWISLVTLAAPLLLAGCGGSNQAVRTTVERMAQAAEAGLNRRNIQEVEGYFARQDEGANEAGMQETQQALAGFSASLTSRDRVQFHSFDVTGVAVHESDGLARVSYRLHLSVIRDSTVIFGAVVKQDLALVRTPRGWRISGGDTPQLSEVSGQWPPRSAQAGR